METSFGADFGNVRVHDSRAAGMLSQDLHAQAFTHGHDIYFNSGKFDAGSPAGQHLLAHELTHTIQQGSSGHLSSKGPATGESSSSFASQQIHAKTADEGKEDKKNIEEDVPDDHGKDKLQLKPGLADADDPPKGNENLVQPVIQRVPEIQKDDTPVTVPKIPEGSIEKTGTGFTIHLENFPLKQYASPYNAPPKAIMPKGKRDTDQKGKWKEGTGTMVNKFMDDLINKANVQNEKLLALTLKRNPAAKILGDKKQLLGEVAVPFWDLGGNPAIHQVEHSIDWQILGKDADHIDNLVLLDRTSNQSLGNSVNQSINRLLQKLIENYRPQFTELKSVKAQDARKSEDYTVVFESYKIEKVTPTGSVISISNLRGVNTPYKTDHFDIKKYDIPDGYFLIRTNPDRAGYLLPYAKDGKNVGAFYMKTEGDHTNGKLTAIILEPRIKDGKKILVKKTKDIYLKNDGNEDHVFITNNKTLALKLRDFIGVDKMSNIIFNETEITPSLGLQTTGIVDTDIDFLKKNNVEISFEILDDDFSIKASISDIVSFPKPFSVDYSSLFIKAGSSSGISVGGDLGFSIASLGKGTIHGTKKQEGFSIEGDFEFESKKFQGSGIHFNYSDKKWEIGGKLKVQKGVLKGVQEAEVTITYSEDKIAGTGSAILDVPGFKKVDLSAEYKLTGEFEIKGRAEMKSMPGIKEGAWVDAMVTKTKDSPDFSLSISGQAKPNLPKIPKLDPEFQVSYIDGLFKAEGKSNFEAKEGMISGDIMVGVTNGVVTEGVLSPKSEGGKSISFYGKGTIKFKPLKGIEAELTVVVNSKGEALYSASVNVHITPFDPIKPAPTTLFDIKQDIPLVGVPFLSLNFSMGVGAQFYLEWLPLDIGVTASFKNKTYDEILGGSFDVPISLTLATSGIAGIKVNINAGASATVAVLKGGADLIGYLKLEGDVIIKGTLNTAWDREKGIKLKDGKGEAKAGINLIPGLSGRVYVDLDLLVSRVNLWQHERKFAEANKTLLFQAGVTAPFAFDDNNSLKPFDPKSITFIPELNDKTAKTQADKTADIEKEKPAPPNGDDVVKNNIRSQIAQNVARKRSNSSMDMYKYLSDLRAHMTASQDPKWTNWVNEAIEDELKKNEIKDFEEFRLSIMASKEPVPKRLAMVDDFEKQHKTIDPGWFITMRTEINSQSASSANTGSVQTKPEESSTGNEERKKLNGVASR